MGKWFDIITGLAVVAGGLFVANKAYNWVQNVDFPDWLSWIWGASSDDGGDGGNSSNPFSSTGDNNPLTPDAETSYDAIFDPLEYFQQIWDSLTNQGYKDTTLLAADDVNIPEPEGVPEWRDDTVNNTTTVPTTVPGDALNSPEVDEYVTNWRTTAASVLTRARTLTSAVTSWGNVKDTDPLSADARVEYTSSGTKVYNADGSITWLPAETGIEATLSDVIGTDHSYLSQEETELQNALLTGVGSINDFFSGITGNNVINYDTLKKWGFLN